ncbi:hypothetical protein HDU96_004454 [Phlyctochytrium bullatum]|nr:hypothetical protein HDU96_004454 [Phlyctochytrium bullatum]
MANDSPNAESNLRENLKLLIQQTHDKMLEREVIAAYAVLAVCSGHHIFLGGPPGAGKTSICERLSSLIRIDGKNTGKQKEGHVYKKQLSQFTTPDEIFGPRDISAVMSSDFRRKINRFLPKATFAVLDEIDKAGSVIQDSMLQILEERVFDNGEKREKVPLIMALATANAPRKSCPDF